MDTYSIWRMLAAASYNSWIAQEFLSTRWWLMLGVLMIYYGIWLRLLNRRIVKDLLVLGSLSACGFIVFSIILAGFFGFWEYRVAVTPFQPAIFMISTSLGPVTFMLCHQYSKSWRSYVAWATVGSGFLGLVLVPVYSWLGIFLLHAPWNYFYHFLYILTDGLIARTILVWLTGIQEAYETSSKTVFSVLQPAATKPLNDEDDNAVK